MDLRNKKINFLGDSITKGSGIRDVYTEILRKRYCLSQARNYGIGGTRIAPKKIPSEDPIYDEDFCSRVDTMEKDADIVVVFGGTNDYGHGDAPIGNVNDTASDTFCGACHVLFQSVKRRFPKSKILILTPLHRINEDISRGADHTGEPKPALEVYANAILEIAQGYDVSVLDLFHMEILDPRDPYVREKYAPDGLHPNDDGHVVLADCIGAALEAL